MASLTFTLGAESFAGIGTAGARMALDYHPGLRLYQVFKFKIPGVAGLFKVRGDTVGGSIVAITRYQGTVANVYSNFQADKDAWENAEISITDPGGTAHTRCELSGFSVLRPLQGIGGGDAIMDLVYTFSVDS